MAEGEIIFYAAFGLVSGIIMFVKGFIYMRQKKLIEELPTSKIRSIAMGLVEIKGKVMRQKDLLVSPLMKKKCLWYKFLVEEYVSAGKHSYWKKLDHGNEFKYFFLKDDTAKVQIDPEKAKIEIPADLKCQTHRKDKPPVQVLEYIKINKIKTTGWLSARRIRFNEWVIKPGDELYVLGTAGDNPFVEDATGKKNVDDIMIQKGKNEKFYYISNKPEIKILKSFRWKIIGGLYGGGALAVGCLAFLLWVFGLF
ncbi:GIDE domain-containing protein [Nanoarchaeota archaeon]